MAFKFQKRNLTVKFLLSILLLKGKDKGNFTLVTTELNVDKN